MEDHHHHHEHGHSHAVDVNGSNYRSFTIGIALNLAFVALEAGAGLWNHSLALLTDAGHNLSDVASLFLSLLAFRFAKRRATNDLTYGYKKTTILAALTNAVLLLVAIGVLGYESILRLQRPAAVAGGTIAWVAAAGILVNGISALLFYRQKKSELNAKGAYLHLLTDALVSVGVVVGGILISYTHRYWIDPLIGLVIMAVIVTSTWSLLRDSFRMAIDAVPPGISMERITQAMRKVENVVDVCHIHVWSISTSETALTAHIVVEAALPFEAKLAVIREVRHQLQHEGIQHSTLELEIQPFATDCGAAPTHG